jgi:hypothetical protein
MFLFRWICGDVNENPTSIFYPSQQALWHVKITCKSGCNFVNEKRLVLYLNLLYHGMKKYIPSGTTNILGVNSPRGGGGGGGLLPPKKTQKMQ